MASGLHELNETPFRVYGLNAKREPVAMGECDDLSLGEMLLDLRKRGKIGDGTRVGIMFRPVEGQPGEWLVNPWN